jgi:hypothetical protein
MRRCNEPGWIQLALPDGHRRGLWIRVTDSVQLCAGREGDDDYVALHASEEERRAVFEVLFSFGYAYDNAGANVAEEIDRLRAQLEHCDTGSEVVTHKTLRVLLNSYGKDWRP